MKPVLDPDALYLGGEGGVLGSDGCGRASAWEAEEAIR